MRNLKNTHPLSDDFLDFIYVGAPRCGSTWLATALGMHPEIWIPRTKEVHFFNDRHLVKFEFKYIKGFRYYKNIFRPDGSDKKLGDVSPLTYFDPNAAYRIYKCFPKVRIIAILRNPVDVVFSYYLLLKRIQVREKTFELELERYPQIMDLGFYHRLLTPFFDWFPKEQIQIFIYEDFFAHQEKYLKRLYRFLGVSEAFLPSIIGKRVNITRASSSSRIVVSTIQAITDLINSPSMQWLKKLVLITRIDRFYYNFIVNSNKPMKKPEVRRQLRDELMAMYEPDIRRLEKKLSIDLNIWRH